MSDEYGLRELTETGALLGGSYRTGSCAFLLAGHGDLRIEWEEKVHDAVVRLLDYKMADGVRFYEIDHSGDQVVPINRRGPTGTHIIVHDDMLKQVIDAGFARFPTTKFVTNGEPKPFRRLHNPEEVARTHTVAVPAPSAAAPLEAVPVFARADVENPEANNDRIDGAAAIIDYLRGRWNVPFGRAPQMRIASMAKLDPTDKSHNIWPLYHQHGPKRRGRIYASRRELDIYFGTPGSQQVKWAAIKAHQNAQIARAGNLD